MLTHATPAARRAGDTAARLRARPAPIRHGHRHLPNLPAQSDHMWGWVLYGLGRPLPPHASAEMHAGYAEARSHVVDVLTAMDPS